VPNQRQASVLLGDTQWHSQLQQASVPVEV
jgi:hypothetical protein